MTRRYSALSLVKEGIAGQKGWAPAYDEDHRRGEE